MSCSKQGSLPNGRVLSALDLYKTDTQDNVCHPTCSPWHIIQCPLFHEAVRPAKPDGMLWRQLSAVSMAAHRQCGAAAATAAALAVLSAAAHSGSSGSSGSAALSSAADAAVGGSRSCSLSAGTGRALALSVDHERIHNNQMVLLVNGSGTSYAEQKWVWLLVNVDNFGGWRRNCNDRRVTEQRN